MSLNFVTDTNPVAGTTSVTPPAPAAGLVQPGDHALICVVNKRPESVPPTPSGWLQVATEQVGSGAAGNDSGPLRISVFYQPVPTGTWTLPTITISGIGATISAGLAVWRTTGLGDTLGFTVAVGSDTSADTAWSVTGDEVLPLAPGNDLLVLGAVTSNDPTFSAAAVAVPGVTLGALGTAWTNSTGVSESLRSLCYHTPVDSVAPGGATGPPTLTATASTGVTGGAVFVRLYIPPHTVHAVTGGMAATGAGSGSRTVERPKSGGAAAVGGGHGQVSSTGAGVALTGGAAARGSGSGMRDTTSAGVQVKTGGASVAPVGSGSVQLAQATSYTGGASLAGGGSGQVEVVNASVIALTGGAALRGSGSGERQRELSPRTGGSVAHVAGGGTAVSEYQFTGGAAAAASGGGKLVVVAVARATVSSEPPLTLTLDRLTAGGHFTGRPPVVDGIELALSGLTGWWGSPEVRTSRTPRLLAPGSHRRQAFKDSRSIEITVTATSRARDPLQMRRTERDLVATCADSERLHLLRVADQAGVTCAYVELDGAVTHALRDGLPWSSVIAVPIVAPDPRRFSPDWSSSTTSPPEDALGGVVATEPGVVATEPGVDAGSPPRPALVTVVGGGSAATQPLVFELSGSVRDVTIIDSRQVSVLGYRGSLGTGDTVWINVDDQPAHDVPGAPGVIPARGALLSDGSNARSAVTRFGRWPVLHPGDVATFAVSGALGPSARFTAHTREAWI